MKIAGRSHRGDPLLLLGLLLVGWAGMRALSWQSPFELGAARRALIADTAVAKGGSGDAGDRATVNAPNFASQLANGRGDQTPRQLDQPLPGLLPVPANDIGPTQRQGGNRMTTTVMTDPGRSTRRQSEPPSFAGAVLGLVDRMLGARPAGTSEASPGIPAAAREPTPIFRAESTGSRLRRWGADAWLLLRKDSAVPLVAGQPSYGRSQAGAVLRYRFARSSPQRPQAYARVSGALESPRDVEVAGGVSARPLAQVPVRVAAEMRLADTRAGTDLRPAALAISEFPPVRLPLDTQGEAYVQGGYVGGDFGTAFIDGQARIARDVAELDEARISAGVGAWGGAQKNASRLDIGPSAFVSFPLGQVRARLAVDYRLRIAGDAEPESGPALTLSAGF